MSSTPQSRPGWVVVLDAFVAAPKRTLTNADLGAIHGIQAWHQRISDLKRYGYVFTRSTKVANGYYAYRLLGLSVAGSDDAPHAADLPRLDPEQARQAKLEAELDLKDLPKPDGGRLTSGDPAPAAATTSSIDESWRPRLVQLLDILGGDVEQTDGAPSLSDMLDEAIACARTVAKRAAMSERAKTVRKSGSTGTTRKPRERSGPALMQQVLAEAGGPLHARDIAAKVLAIDGARPAAERAYKGKTPAATMAAQLSTSNKKSDGVFVRTASNTYGLRDRDEQEAS